MGDQGFFETTLQEAKAALKVVCKKSVKSSRFSARGCDAIVALGDSRVYPRVVVTCNSVAGDSQDTPWSWVAVNLTESSHFGGDVITVAEVTLKSQPTREVWEAAIMAAMHMAQVKLGRATRALS